jgi:hypothetical protein
MFNRWLPESHLQLLIVGVAMECLYVGILCLNNLKENIETFIPLLLAQGALYLCSIYIAEKVPPRRSHLVLVFAAAAVFRLTLFPLYPSLSDDLYRYQWDAKAQRATTPTWLPPTIQHWNFSGTLQIPRSAVQNTQPSTGLSCKKSFGSRSFCCAA